MDSNKLFKLNNTKPLIIRSETILDKKNEIQIKNIGNAHIQHLGINKIIISDLEKINKDILIMLKHIYIDLFNFIINLESNTGASKEFKSDLHKFILEHIKI